MVDNRRSKLEFDAQKNWLPMESEVFIQFAIIIGSATFLGFVLHALRQPLVAAYILAGVLISFLQPFGGISTHGPLEFLPDIGVAFLLFLIGLELDFRELRLIGKPIVLASITQMAITTAIVGVLTTFMDFSATESLLVGLALSFSSTIVAIKLLADKQEVTSLHGKVAIGMLIVEDLVAILALMFLSLSSSVVSLGLTNAFPFIALILKGLLLFGLVVLLIRFVIPWLFRLLAVNQELLFLSAISWCFMFIMLSGFLGFSLEIGAFLGGVSLAATSYRYQIAGRVKPLRDFFIAIFFVDLGMGIVFSEIVMQAKYIFLFSLYALVIKPVEIIGILSLLKFRRFTSYHTATVLSQVSEFSVILLVAAQRSGFVSRDMVSTLAATTVITIFISAILVNQNERVYPLFAKVLKAFERKSRNNAHVTHKELVNHTVLIGANRAGEPVLHFLKKKVGGQLLVVDYNPSIVQNLETEQVRVLFGDISDPEVLNQLNLGKANMVISTIREIKDNLTVLQAASNMQSTAIYIMAAVNEDEAELLYKKGAHEVIVPITLEGMHIVQSLERHWEDDDYFERLRKRNMPEGTA